MSEPVNLAEQLESLLTIVEKAGHALREDAAVFAEHGGSVDDLRDYVARSGRLGDSMVAAVTRTRRKLADTKEER